MLGLLLLLIYYLLFLWFGGDGGLITLTAYYNDEFKRNQRFFSRMFRR